MVVQSNHMTDILSKNKCVCYICYTDGWTKEGKNEFVDNDRKIVDNKQSIEQNVSYSWRSFFGYFFLKFVLKMVSRN